MYFTRASVVNLICPFLVGRWFVFIIFLLPKYLFKGCALGVVHFNLGNIFVIAFQITDLSIFLDLRQLRLTCVFSVSILTCVSFEIFFFAYFVIEII